MTTTQQDLNNKFQNKLNETKNNTDFILKDNYINYNTEAKFYHTKCESYFTITPRNLLKLNSQYCPNCSPNRRRNDKEFRSDILKINPDIKIISDEEIKNVRQRIEVQCLLCNRKWKPEVRKLLEGNKCTCNRSNIERYYDDRRFTLDEAKSLVNELDKDYEVIDDNYVNCHSPLKILHKSCNQVSNISLNNFIHENTRCKCQSYKPISLSEKEIISFIKKIYKGTIQTSNRKILNGKELDIYLTELNLAIEFDGLYWHCDKFKPNNYHLDKTNECNKCNIRLIHIFEDEWRDKQKIVKEKLRYILNCSNKNRIYARNCWIKEIDSKTKNKFLDKYHIQGRDNSKIKLGLFTKSPKTGKTILVSVMTFCKPRLALGQKNSKFDYELSRFASTYNYIIVGGFSKLFKYFERNYEWNTLITYADIRWSQGDVYIKNGWYYDHDSKPNYWYTDGNKKEYRFKFRKSELKKLFPDIYSDDKSEKEIMNESGYHRIYDCGNMVFTYTRN